MIGTMETDHPSTRATLLLRLREPSDQAAWREFCDLYLTLLRGYAAVKGVEAQDVDDVVQEVAKTVVKAIRGFDYDPGKGTFRDWLFIVTRSKVAKHFRTLARKPRSTGGTLNLRLLEEQPAPEEEKHWETEYRRRMFEWAAPQVQAEVRDRTWRAFWLTVVEDRPIDEVAEELGMKPGAIYVARSRVVARLRACIARVTGEPLQPEPFV